MSAEQRGRPVALVVMLVGAALATVLLFSPFVAEYATDGAGPVHLRDAWRLTTASPLDGGQRVATGWAVLVIVATLATLIGGWAGAHLDQLLPLVVAGAGSLLAMIAGFAVRGEGRFGDFEEYHWTSYWGLAAWQGAHALVLVALVAYGYARSQETDGDSTPPNTPRQGSDR